MGRGVVLYIKQGIEFFKLQSIKQINSLPEAIYVEILGPRGYLKVGIYYYPPGQILKADLEMDKG